MQDHGLIVTETALSALAESLGGSEWIAVDTEFMREKTFFPQLCLLQVATPNHIACVDLLALPNPAPLTRLLLDTTVLKVFHAASQDLEALYHLAGSVPAPVFDTQIAASLLGHGEQVGYANLVQGVLGQEIDKGQARTDWARRPLSPAQIRYAQDDVRYLVVLYEHLHDELRRLDRSDWLQPEMEALVRPETYVLPLGSEWRRVSGSKRLRPRELAVLRELAAWRENEARTLNRPRRWVLADDLLLAIVRARPADSPSLRGIRGFPRTIRDSQSEQILAAVQRGLDCPSECWPEATRRQALSDSEEAVVDAAMGLLRELAQSQGVGPEAVGNRKDVAALMRGDDEAALGRGWRYRVAGERLLQWLTGTAAMICEDSRVQLRATGDRPRDLSR